MRVRRDRIRRQLAKLLKGAAAKGADERTREIIRRGFIAGVVATNHALNDAADCPHIGHYKAVIDEIEKLSDEMEPDLKRLVAVAGVH